AVATATPPPRPHPERLTATQPPPPPHGPERPPGRGDVRSLALVTPASRATIRRRKRPQVRRAPERPQEWSPLHFGRRWRTSAPDQQDLPPTGDRRRADRGRAAPLGEDPDGRHKR